jgi:hypothetical protein
LLQGLRRAGASDAVRTLLDRDPAAHVSLDDAQFVAELLRALREAGADDEFRALAAWAAAGASLDPWHVAELLRTLHEAGAYDEARTLAGRAAAHVSLDHPRTVAMLLRMLHWVGAGDAVTILLARAADAGMFDLFREAHPDENRFGREPDGTPSQPWRWHKPAG